MEVTLCRGDVLGLTGESGAGKSMIGMEAVAVPEASVASAAERSGSRESNCAVRPRCTFGSSAESALLMWHSLPRQRLTPRIS